MAKHKSHGLEELTLLDLNKCNTVNDIVLGMSKCSFGARMLGEAADKICGMAEKGKAAIIYDGLPDTRLGMLLNHLVERGWFSKVLLPEDYSSSRDRDVVVIGPYSERHADAIHTIPKKAIYINMEGNTRPGLVKDGYFPDVVFSDPHFVMPVLYHVIDERLSGQKTTAWQLKEHLKGFGGIADEVADGAENLERMIADKRCKVFMTLSGAMTVAQMGLVITEFIDRGYVQSITSTGALMAHGLVESMGLKHYKHNPRVGDAALARMGHNRVTDTIEPETNFDHIDEVMSAVLDSLDKPGIISPSELNRCIGEYLATHFPDERAILKSAYKKGIPVFVPAFVDSEIGNDVYTYKMIQQIEGKPDITIDPMLDNRNLIDLVQQARKTGIFTIGGGVPRNWTQNVGPLIEIARNRTGVKLVNRMLSYGVKICPDKMWYGHLGGCTYEEGKSWRKMRPNGIFVEVHADATVTWPFMAKYVMDRLDK